MTPGIVDALLQTSLFYSTDPEAVYTRIIEAVSEYYSAAGGDSSERAPRRTMAMLNLRDGECLRFKTVANRHRLFARTDTFALEHTLCQYSLKNRSPLLIQNAAQHPVFCHHPVVRLKLRRYLGVPVWNSAGEPIGTLCFLDDRVDDLLGDDDIRFISLLAMRVSAELERERTIQARIDEEARYTRQLEKTAEEKRNFVSMVIHDLRHPLTSMRTELYLLRNEPDPGRRANQIDALDNRTQLLSTMLDELVLYDQVEAGKSRISLETIAVSEFLQQCIQHGAVSSVPNEVPVSYDIDAELPPVTTDAAKLRHVILNLVANALKYTQQGVVTVSATRVDENKWALTVSDTGTGIGLEELSRVFEPYYCGSGNSGRGAGLGLAIAHRLSTVLQGEMTFHSVSGEGAWFRVEMPIELGESYSDAQ